MSLYEVLISWYLSTFIGGHFRSTCRTKYSTGPNFISENKWQIVKLLCDCLSQPQPPRLNAALNNWTHKDAHGLRFNLPLQISFTFVMAQFIEVTLARPYSYFNDTWTDPRQSARALTPSSLIIPTVSINISWQLVVKKYYFIEIQRIFRFSHYLREPLLGDGDEEVLEKAILELDSYIL